MSDKVAALQAAVNQNAGAVAAVQSSVADPTARVNALQNAGAVAAVQSSVADLTARVNALQNPAPVVQDPPELDAITSTLQAANDQLGQVKAAIDAIAPAPSAPAQS